MNQTVDEDGDSLVDFILFQPKLTAKEEGSYQVSWAEIKQPKENNLIYYSRFLLDMTELKDHSNLFCGNKGGRQLDLLLGGFGWKKSGQFESNEG